MVVLSFLLLRAWSFRKIRKTGVFQAPVFFFEIGAGEEIRTLDPNLGKVVLYH
jgi:hypothetical protein